MKKRLFAILVSVSLLSQEGIKWLWTEFNG